MNGLRFEVGEVVARKPRFKVTNVSVEKMRSLLTYEPLTGKFFWSNCNDVKANVRGKEAGNLSRHGYIRIKINRAEYFAHRIAYALMTGAWPLLIVDHINGIKTDNRWSNLRLATDMESTWNTRGHRVRRSRYKGVYKNAHCKTWYSTIRSNGKSYFLGSFKTEDEAAAAYNEAAKRLHGVFAPAEPASLTRVEEIGVGA